MKRPVEIKLENTESINSCNGLVCAHQKQTKIGCEILNDGLKHFKWFFIVIKNSNHIIFHCSEDNIWYKKQKSRALYNDMLWIWFKKIFQIKLSYVVISDIPKSKEVNEIRFLYILKEKRVQVFRNKHQIWFARRLEICAK